MWPLRMPYHVTVSFGKPLPPDTPIETVRQAVARGQGEEHPGVLQLGAARPARETLVAHHAARADLDDVERLRNGGDEPNGGAEFDRGRLGVRG